MPDEKSDKEKKEVKPPVEKKLEEKKPVLPIPVEVNEIVRVWDGTRGEWYNARWAVFTVGEANLFAAIDINSAGTISVASGRAGKRMLITSITLTVSAECDLTLRSSYGAISGVMDFGGSDEPRGMALNLGNFYIELPAGSGFSISVSTEETAIHVGGLVTYVLR